MATRPWAGPGRGIATLQGTSQLLADATEDPTDGAARDSPSRRVVIEQGTSSPVLSSPSARPTTGLKRTGIYIPPSPAGQASASGCQQLAGSEADDDDDVIAGGCIDSYPPEVPSWIPRHNDAESLRTARTKLDRANEIARELGKQAQFRVTPHDGEATALAVTVTALLPDGVERIWDWRTFELRLRAMERLVRKWKRAVEKGRAFTEPTDSPFNDASDLLLGEASVFLMSLANMIDHEASAALFMPGQQHSKGSVDLQVLPLDHTGGRGPWAGDRKHLDPFVDDSQQLLGKTISFAVRVLRVHLREDDASTRRKDWEPPKPGAAVLPPSAIGKHELPPTSKYRGVWIRYKIDKNDAGELPTSMRPCELPPFTWPAEETERVFTRHVDEHFLRHLQTSCISLEVWGHSADARPPPPRVFTEPNPSWRRPAVVQAEREERFRRALEIARHGSCSGPSLPTERAASNPLNPDPQDAVAAVQGGSFMNPRYRKLCVVCGRADRAGELRKSGWKCKECVGIPATVRRVD